MIRKVLAAGLLTGVALADAQAPAAPDAPAPDAPAAPGLTEHPGTRSGNGLTDAFSHPYELQLGQAPSNAIGYDPSLNNPLSQSDFLNPKRYRVPGAEADNQYALQPGVDGPFARVDGLKGTHAMLHGALGRMPHEQMSQPLPGTAPPPGTNIPVGELGNLDDPEAATVPVYGTAPAPAGSAPRLAQPAPPVEDAPAP
jgi:hypothetical protein